MIQVRCLHFDGYDGASGLLHESGTPNGAPFGKLSGWGEVEGRILASTKVMVRFIATDLDAMLHHHVARFSIGVMIENDALSGSGRAPGVWTFIHGVVLQLLNKQAGINREKLFVHVSKNPCGTLVCQNPGH